MMKTVKEIVSSEEMDKAFANTNFGSVSPRDVIRYNLLKILGGYYIGHTAKVILIELGLISPKQSILKKGRDYLFAAFYTGNY